MPNEPELIARATATASAVRSRSAPGWSTRVLTGSRMSFTPESRVRSTAWEKTSASRSRFCARLAPGKPTPEPSTIRGTPSRRAFSTPRSRPSKNGPKSVPGKVKFVRGSARTEVSATPLSDSAFARALTSLSRVPHISTASKPAAAAARTRAAGSGPASVKSSSMFGESWYTRVLLQERVVVVRGFRDRLDDVPVLDDLSAGHAVQVHDGAAALVSAVAVQVDDAVVAVGEHSLE